jgi:hypothetical protein
MTTCKSHNMPPGNTCSPRNTARLAEISSARAANCLPSPDFTQTLQLRIAKIP